MNAPTVPLSPFRRPIAVDLFAGVGGFSLGMEQAGFDVVVAVEKDPIHAAAYTYNFPQTRVLCADITTISGADIVHLVQQQVPQFQQIDLIFGGPPCQGFSIIGPRNPKDKRNQLIFEFCRLVRELQPRYFVLENVPGLKQPKNQSLLRRLKRELRGAGYQITERVRILNAVDFGVPQTRKRLFLLGRREGAVKFCYPPPQKNPPTVRDALQDLPNLDDFPHLNQSDELWLSQEELRALDETISPYGERLRGKGDGGNLAYPRRWNPHCLTGFRRTQHEASTIERFRQTPAGQREEISRLRKLGWDEYCCTLRAGTPSERGRHTSARPLHPEYERVISVREAARLHSFPDWFGFHVTKWHGFRQVGNSVPPLLGRAIGQQAIAALQVTPFSPSIVLELGDRALLQFTPSQAEQYFIHQHI
ncbi:DNA cytosine methyltransferase [Spirulina subsalsa FACHB-351]|uniref:Cytosine-specific methyltransferase n=1 Tax=Spirulina subsalsa FACHB-351 TaxID=234711 RepID=A0ABT3L2Z1_9CYAN|nr:DNA cytosine methyltransferase [Spirulina subsalsa]MCW6035878.1 DNA cytosine methyltransferase [Spirulina subsalsa FACHB-351]